MKRNSRSATSKNQYPGRSSQKPAAGVEGSNLSPEIETSFLIAYPLARRASGVRATAAVASGAVSEVDGEDLEQEGLIACWRALRLFDPNRASLRTFIEHVVAARMTSLHRARRCRPRFQPLEDDQHPVATGWVREIELRSDVQLVLDGLPDGDRQLALTLIEHTPSEASRLLGIARSTIYERIRRIRTAFINAGLYARRNGDRR